MQIPTLPTLPKLTCGISLNLDNLKGDLTARAAGILNIDLGTPAGLAEISASINGTLSDIKGQVAAVLVIPPVMKTLRDELAELAALPMAGIAAAAKIVSIAEDYAGALGLTGFANLNLNDLSKSVFSLGTSFDPCNMSIPNISLDPITGGLQKLPSIQPLLGNTVAAAKVAVPQHNITDNLSLALASNTEITEDLPAPEAKEIIEENVSTSVTGMGNSIKTQPDNTKVVETKEAYIDTVKPRSSLLGDKKLKFRSPRKKANYEFRQEMRKHQRAFYRSFKGSRRERRVAWMAEFKNNLVHTIPDNRHPDDKDVPVFMQPIYNKR